MLLEVLQIAQNEQPVFLDLLLEVSVDHRDGEPDHSVDSLREAFGYRVQGLPGAQHRVAGQAGLSPRGEPEPVPLRNAAQQPGLMLIL